ncbi:hypothetical protein GJ496_009000 [Pomphorhynchus laevis]|nr:hypothetical protein GJ496_009000 [Pomphorhynchus laevis]
MKKEIKVSQGRGNMKGLFIALFFISIVCALIMTITWLTETGRNIPMNNKSEFNILHVHDALQHDSFDVGFNGTHITRVSKGQLHLIDLSCPGYPNISKYMANELIKYGISSVRDFKSDYILLALQQKDKAACPEIGNFLLMSLEDFNFTEIAINECSSRLHLVGQGNMLLKFGDPISKIYKYEYNDLHFKCSFVIDIIDTIMLENRFASEYCILLTSLNDNNVQISLLVLNDCQLLQIKDKSIYPNNVKVKWIDGETFIIIYTEFNNGLQSERIKIIDLSNNHQSIIFHEHRVNTIATTLPEVVTMKQNEIILLDHLDFSRVRMRKLSRHKKSVRNQTWHFRQMRIVTLVDTRNKSAISSYSSKQLIGIGDSVNIFFADSIFIYRTSDYGQTWITLGRYKCDSDPILFVGNVYNVIHCKETFVWRLYNLSLFSINEIYKLPTSMSELSETMHIPKVAKIQVKHKDFLAILPIIKNAKIQSNFPLILNLGCDQRYSDKLAVQMYLASIGFTSLSCIRTTDLSTSFSLSKRLLQRVIHRLTNITEYNINGTHIGVIIQGSFVANHVTELSYTVNVNCIFFISPSLNIYKGPSRVRQFNMTKIDESLMDEQTRIYVNLLNSKSIVTGVLHGSNEDPSVILTSHLLIRYLLYGNNASFEYLVYPEQSQFSYFSSYAKVDASRKIARFFDNCLRLTNKGCMRSL